jgi:hypothetical protein
MTYAALSRMLRLRARVGSVALLGVCFACGEVDGPSDRNGTAPDPTEPFPTAPRLAYETLQGRWDLQGMVTGDEVFSRNEEHILKDGEPFLVRGIVYVPGYPGSLPWDIEAVSTLPERLKQSIDRDLAQIAAAGANTVRLWGAPEYCYRSLKAMGRLFLLQTLWIDAEVPDLHDPSFKQATKAYVRTVIDRIYRVYSEGSPPLIAYLVGNELSASTIQATNAAHPELTAYDGSYVATSADLNASEVFLAEMADYVKRYEHETYGAVHLVSYANDIRTADLIDTPFLDFRSHNAYSYAVSYYRPGTTLGTVTGTHLQGWIEELKARVPEIPLLITETGLSVSPNAPHVGPPDYGYGGNTETEQAAGLLQAVEDVATAQPPVAGVIIHELLDAWWKFGLEDSYTQDPDDVEEWFGIVRLTGP